MVRSGRRTTRRSNRRTHRRSSKRSHIKRNDGDDAGKAIAAGGFGCVFKPAIACANPDITKKMKRSGYEYITKVMEARYAKDEMKEVDTVLPIVSKIPNHKRYFLVDGIFECKKFGPLTSENLKGLDSTCTNLSRIGIVASNINVNLSSLSAIYIPYGGESVATEMKRLALDYNRVHDTPAQVKFVSKDIGILSYALADVLEHAIVPMNKLNLIHLDLKGDNLLFNESVLDDGKMPYIKVIDWGLAGKVPSKGIANAAKDRPFQFNAPFSNILFNKRIIDNAVKMHSGGRDLVITDAQMPLIATTIVNTMLSFWEGHAKYIAQDINRFITPFAMSTSKGEIAALSSDAKCTTEVVTLIVNYITPILKKYWHEGVYGLYSGFQGSFNADKYFQEVYRYNCDVWGVIVCYQDFLNRISSYTLHRQSEILKVMSNILFKYCFSPTYAAERIPVESVMRDMRALGRLCGVMQKPTPESPNTPPPVPKAATIALVSPPGARDKSLEEEILLMPNATYSPQAAKKTKTKLVLRVASHAKGSPQTVSLKGKKRCPKGYSKHPSKSGKCRKTVKKAKKTSSKKVTNINTARQSLPLGRKRCPTGYSKVSGDGVTTKIICAKK
jgi:serine/threonine protein kinase